MSNETKTWQDRHDNAWSATRITSSPVGVSLSHEGSVVALVKAWENYALAHEQALGSTIGEDQILGAAWGDIGHAIRTLLNGETGRLDCGTVDSRLCKKLEAEGLLEP